jgi:hypothetical protein
MYQVSNQMAYSSSMVVKEDHVPVTRASQRVVGKFRQVRCLRLANNEFNFPNGK